MAENFIACDREQELLLPPGLREWLPADHLAWFVLDAVDAMDLKAFFAGYRDDGWGRAAHDSANRPLTPAARIQLNDRGRSSPRRPRGR